MVSVSKRIKTRVVALWMLLPCATLVRAEPVLRTAAEVQVLTPEQAKTHLKVELRGVVTFAWHTESTEFTVQDDTGAVWIPAMKLPPDCVVGTAVEIEGYTERGGFGPVVKAQTVRVAGPAKLPEPRPASYEELTTAQFYAERVEVIGIVRGQRVNPEFGLGWLALEIAIGGGRVTVNVTHEITGHPELLDARVRIRGVSLHISDEHQQSFLPMVNAHSLADVEVLDPPDPRPFSEQTVRLNQVMRSASVRGAGHRVHVHGTVTFVRRGGSFFLQDETRGLQVFLRESPSPEVGEVVDVVGFPEPGAFSPVLRDADWRPTGEIKATPPLQLKPEGAIDHDGLLINVAAMLTGLAAGDEEAILTLEEEQQHFRAHVPQGRIGQWKVGSKLRVTGVCSVEVGDWESLVTHRRPQGFALLVPSPSNVVQIHGPPLWTPTHIAWLLVWVGAALGVALGVVWTRTRRRLREVARTREAARAQFAAVIGERTRMAREIHDTLAQGFAGISAQLEVLSDRLSTLPDSTRQHLDLARELASNSLSEARRTVWNLRAQTLDEHGLAGALDRLGHQLSKSRGVVFTMQVDGVARELPADVENNFLRIGQESITNCVRHSGARRLNLKLTFRADHVSLSITDDGHGFDPEHVGPGETGGFGLPGIRERAEAMHGRLEVRSVKGSGTTLEVTVPHV